MNEDHREALVFIGPAQLFVYVLVWLDHPKLLSSGEASLFLSGRKVLPSGVYSLVEYRKIRKGVPPEGRLPGQANADTQPEVEFYYVKEVLTSTPVGPRPDRKPID